MSAPAAGAQEWRDIHWPRLERHVHRLQRRIYRVSQRGDTRTVHRLQRLLLSSWSAKCLAVRRVTQDNQGKNTPGVDGVAALEPEARLDLVTSFHLDARPQPIRRVWIPKPGTDEQRPLGIPTLSDRTRQALVKLVALLASFSSPPCSLIALLSTSRGSSPRRGCAIVKRIHGQRREPSTHRRSPRYDVAVRRPVSGSQMARCGARSASASC